MQWRFSQSLDQTLGQNQFLFAESVSEPEPAERKLPAQASPPPTNRKEHYFFWGQKNVLLPDGENDWVITSHVESIKRI